MDNESPAAAPPAGASRRLMAIVMAAVLALAAAGYWWTGTPDPQAARAQAERAAAADEAAAQGGLDAEQLEGLVAKLQERVQAQPDEAQSWVMLGRAQAMLGRTAEAVAAYAKAVALGGDDPRLLTDYAEALGMQSGRDLRGEPTRLLERALQADPKWPKALALAGAAAFDRQDYATAVRRWDQLIELSDPQADYLPQLREGIARARELGKLPAAAAAPAAATSAAALPASVSGSVALAPALAAQARPEDTVFVFARAAEGSRMPLVMLRKQVKDLPLNFTLDDSQSMSPAMRLSSAAQVVVVARISRSGQAAPQPGDLSGQSPAVTLGSSGVRVMIDEVIAKP